MPAVPVIIYYINEPLSFILLYMLRGYRLSFTFVQTIGYIFISFTLPLLFTLMRIIKILLLCYYVSDLSRINSSFRIRVRNPYTKKEREREREREREPHINLHIVDRTIPPSIASPGICKIIGHYPDPKSRSAERSLILDTVRMQ